MQRRGEVNILPSRGVAICFLKASTTEPDVTWHFSWPKGVWWVDVPPKLSLGSGGRTTVPKIAILLFLRGGSGSIVDDSVGEGMLWFA